MQLPDPPYPFPAGVVPRRIQIDQDFKPNVNPMDDPFLTPNSPNSPNSPTEASKVSALLSVPTMVTKYPKYYKDVSHLKAIDVYGVHQLFGIEDSSGAIQHASKKLLLSGVRTGGKTKYHDIQEARDTLSRWLELNKE